MNQPTKHGLRKRHENNPLRENCHECGGDGRSGFSPACPFCAGLGWTPVKPKNQEEDQTPREAIPIFILKLRPKKRPHFRRMVKSEAQKGEEAPPLWTEHIERADPQCTLTHDELVTQEELARKLALTREHIDEIVRLEGLAEGERLVAVVAFPPEMTQ